MPDIAPHILAGLIGGGYLLGSIPFGLILTRLAGGGDIRKVGSGNIGATNVLRTGRKGLALATLLLDGGKAALACLIGYLFVSQDAGLIAGAAALIGHCFPVWLKFRGGKGVATFFGLFLAGLWPVGVVAALIWLSVAYTFRYSSLAALWAAASTPLMALAFRQSEVALAVSLICAVVIFWRHGQNIARLRAGTEPKIGAAKAPPAAPAG